jgi:hypothetical protein
MYQLLPSVMGRESQFIKRLSDHALVFIDPANTDYQAYLKWLEEGGQPLPADEGESN